MKTVFEANDRIRVGNLYGTVIDPVPQWRKNIDPYRERLRILVIWDGGDGEPTWATVDKLSKVYS